MLCIYWMEQGTSDWFVAIIITDQTKQGGSILILFVYRLRYVDYYYLFPPNQLLFYSCLYGIKTKVRIAQTDRVHFHSVADSAIS